MNDTAPTRSRSTGSDETAAKIAEWLQICDSHEVCSKWRHIVRANTGLPSRLIEITTAAEGTTIRLVHTADLPAVTTAYATLSYCWGGQVPTCLLTTNIEQFRANIPWDRLTQTFREAIYTASKLNLSYIWIDALCIVQDSPEDWSIEAADMARVYANSSLNISAEASEDGEQGLFRERDLEFTSAFLVRVRGKSYLCFRNTWDDDVENSPLAERAWAVQERFLAPRIVHFGQQQVYWECFRHAAIEALPASMDVFGYGDNSTARYSGLKRMSRPLRQHLANSIPAHVDFYTLWDRLRHHYSNRLLSFPTDKPVALAGLARTFESLLGLTQQDYIYGMWLPRLPSDLMWRAYASFDFDYERVPESNVPSWSWLSISCGIKISPRRKPADAGDDEDSSTIVMTVLTVDTVSEVERSVPRLPSVVIRAQLCSAIVMRSGNPLYYLDYTDSHHQHDHILKLGNAELLEDKSFVLAWDDNATHTIAQLLHRPLYLMLGRVMYYLTSSEPSSEISHEYSTQLRSSTLR